MLDQRNDSIVVAVAGPGCPMKHRLSGLAALFLAATGHFLPHDEQFLGMTARARYCAGGATAGGLAVAVCEYDSAADAAAGRAFVEERYAAMNSFRRIHVRGATTLTLATAPEVALGDEARRVGEVFESL